MGDCENLSFANSPIRLLLTALYKLIHVLEQQIEFALLPVGQFDRFELPLPPAAVLAANDIRAADVIGAAKDAGIAIPEGLSILGIDNDASVCDNASPGISSLEPNHFAEGRVAAETLEQMMKRSHPGKRRVAVGVRQVVIRQSTQNLPPAQDLVERARRFIDAHATEGIGPLCGFANANALKNLFRRQTGMSMRDYRRAEHSSASASSAGAAPPTGSPPRLFTESRSCTDARPPDCRSRTTAS